MLRTVLIVSLVFSGAVAFAYEDKPAAPTTSISQGPDVQAEYAKRFPTSPSADTSPLTAKPVAVTSETGTFVVQVEDEDGNRIPKAKATWEPLRSRAPFLGLSMAVTSAAFEPLLEENEQRSVVSDDNGALRLEGVPKRQSILIRVEASESYGAAQLIRSFDSRDETRLGGRIIVPGPSRTLAIQLRSPRGLLPPGTAVVVQSRPSWFHDPLPSRLACNDVQAGWGDQPLLVEVPRQDLALSVFVPGVGVWRGLPIDKDVGDTAEVLLDDRETATLSGTLRTGDGRAIAGARLALIVKPFLRRKPERSRVLLGRSSDGGSFSFRAPAGRIEELRVIAPGVVPPRELLNKVALRPNETLSVDLALVSGHSIEGVIQNKDGERVAGATVRARVNGAEFWGDRWAATDAQGRYRLDDLPLGELSLDVRIREGVYGAKRVKHTVTKGGSRAEPIQVDDSKPTEESSRISGVVIDDRGRPVSGATVSYAVSMEGTIRGGTDHTRKSSVDGSFSLTPPAKNVIEAKVWASKNGLSSPASLLSLDAVGTQRVELVLPTPGRLRGTVKTEQGEPVPYVRVSVEGTRVVATTDEQGAYDFRAVPRGRQVLVVKTPQGERIADKRAVLIRSEDTTAHLKTNKDAVVLLLTGQLLGPKGKPLPGVVVEAKEPGPWRGTEATTDTSGYFRIPIAKPGRYPIRSGLTLLGHLLAGQPAKVLEFDPRAIRFVQGVVREADGVPVYRAMVELIRLKSGRVAESHSVGGYFRMEVPHGFDQFHLQSRGWGMDRFGVKRSATFENKTVDVNNTLYVCSAEPRDGELRGFVVDQHGEPVVGQHIRAGGPWANTGPQGDFHLRGMARGTCKISVTVRTPYRSEVDEAVVDPRKGPVRIRLERIPDDEMFDAEGQVVDKNGKPAVGVPLDLCGDNHWSSLKSDAEGEFQLRNLLRGKDYWIETDDFWTPPGMERGDGSARVDVSPTGKTILKLPYVILGPDDLHEVSGELYDAVGDVLPGSSLRVWLQRVGKRRRFEGQMNGTRFRITGVPDGRYEVYADGSGGYVRSDPVVIDVPSMSVRVALRRAHRLHGLVEKDFEGFVIYSCGESGYHGRSVDSTGRFAFDMRGEIPRTLFLHKPGDDRYALIRDALPAASPHKLQLQKGARIEGRLEPWVVRKKHRTEISAAGNGVFAEGEVFDDGRFVVTGLPPGTYRLSVSLSESLGGDFPPLSAKAGDTDVVVKFKKY